MAFFETQNGQLKDRNVEDTYESRKNKREKEKNDEWGEGEENKKNEQNFGRNHNEK